MKRYCIVFLLLIASFPSGAYESIYQWMLFTGNYSFQNGKIDMNMNLGSNQVNAIAEDNNGNIWMGGRGLRMFDGKKLLQPKIPKESFAYNADVLALAVDNRNVLWIGTSEGLVKYDGATWTNYGPEVINMRSVKDIAITATDKVYIAGMSSGTGGLVGAGIAFFNGQSWTNFNKSNSAIPDDLVEDLVLDKNGALWMTVGNHVAGVARFDGKNWKTFNTSNTPFPTDMVRAIATNSSGMLWFVTPQGLISFDGKEWKLRAFSNGFGTKLLAYTGGHNQMIDAQSLAVENNGTIWIGAKNEGVYCFRKKGMRLYTTERTPLTGNSVGRILVDKNDRKWLVTGARNEYWAGRGVYEA